MVKIQCYSCLGNWLLFFYFLFFWCFIKNLNNGRLSSLVKKPKYASRLQENLKAAVNRLYNCQPLLALTDYPSQAVTLTLFRQKKKEPTLP